MTSALLVVEAAVKPVVADPWLARSGSGSPGETSYPDSSSWVSSGSSASSSRAFAIRAGARTRPGERNRVGGPGDDRVAHERVDPTSVHPLAAVESRLDLSGLPGGLACDRDGTARLEPRLDHIGVVPRRSRSGRPSS